MRGVCQFARQHHLAVQRGAGNVHNGVVGVIAFGQHGVDGRNGTMSMTTDTGAFNQIGQQSKHRRRVAFGGGRLANGQANFALRMGHACEAVDQHQDVQALVAKVFGNHVRHVRCFQAKHWRHVGGRCHHHRFGQTFFTQGFLNEGLHLTATLADQTNHHHIGFGEAGHHAQQHTLAYARACDQADALSAAQGQQTVDGFHAHVQYAVDGSSFHGVDGQAQQTQACFASRLGFAV